MFCVFLASATILGRLHVQLLPILYVKTLFSSTHASRFTVRMLTILPLTLPAKFSAYTDVKEQVDLIHEAMRTYEKLFDSEYLTIDRQSAATNTRSPVRRFSICRKHSDKFPHKWSGHFVAVRKENCFEFMPFGTGLVQGRSGNFEKANYNLLTTGAWQNIEEVIFFELEYNDYFIGHKTEILVKEEMKPTFSGVCVYKIKGIEYAGEVQQNTPNGFGLKIIRCGKDLEMLQPTNEMIPVVEVHQIGIFKNNAPDKLVYQQSYQCGGSKWEPTYNNSFIMSLDDEDEILSLYRTEWVNYDKGNVLGNMRCMGKTHEKKDWWVLERIENRYFPVPERESVPWYLYTPYQEMKVGGGHNDATQRVVDVKSGEYYSILTMMGYSLQDDANAVHTGLNVEGFQVICVHNSVHSENYKRSFDKNKQHYDRVQNGKWEGRIVIMISKCETEANFAEWSQSFVSRTINTNSPDSNCMFYVFENVQKMLKDLPNILPQQKHWRVVIARRMALYQDAGVSNGQIAVKENDFWRVDFLYTCQFKFSQECKLIDKLSSNSCSNLSSPSCRHIHDMVPDHTSLTATFAEAKNMFKNGIMDSGFKFDLSLCKFTELCLRTELHAKGVNMKKWTIGIITNPPCAFLFCLGAIVFVLGKQESTQDSMDTRLLVWFYQFNFRKEVEDRVSFVCNDPESDLPVFANERERDEIMHMRYVRHNFTDAHFHQLVLPFSQGNNDIMTNHDIRTTTLLLPRSCVCELKSFRQ
jgi:hypothetical protein